jgi:hypothetical protein
MVTGDGYGHREFRRQPFGHRQLEPGHWRLKAERLTPGRPTTVAVTRHLECIMPAANIPVSGLPLSEEPYGRGATVSRPMGQGGRVADASLPEAISRHRPPVA